MRRLPVSLCSSVLFSVLLTASAWAQLASQTALVGTVTDQGGLVVPGAQVVAVNVGTRDTYETTTNVEGYYNIQFVRTGVYEITVTLTGFQTSRVSGVEVANNQVARTNITMSVGQLNESITVAGSAPLIDTDSARISETIGTRAVSDLPLNGRNVWNLASTTPGVLGGLTSDIGLSFRGAGQREIQNSLSLDGINSSANLLAATSMRPITDAVEEVQIQTGSTSAEYGSYLGVHINVVTKSGTNTPHGSLFEFYQDDALDERGYFENRSVPKNPRQRNQFGVELDGPVMFPKFYDGRNRTFITAAYEGVRANTLFSPIATVPTALMRQGNFSEITGTIRNPFTKEPYPGNIIPPSQLSSTARSLLAYYPMPNRAGIASNLQTPIPSTENVDQFIGRADQNIGNKVRLSVRYNWHDSANSNPLGAVLPTQSVDQPRVNKNTLVSYTHTLSQNLFNDFRVGYHRVNFDTLNPFLVSGQSTAGSDLGIPGFTGDVQYNNPGIPTIDLTNAFSGLGGGGTNWYQFDTTFQLSDVAAYNRGSHNVRFGFDLRRLQTGRRAANDPRGRFNFTGDMTGHPVADFMLGLPRTVIPPTDQIQGDVGGWRNGFFVNDVWQASHDLTFSLGLRYELNTPVKTYAGLASMLAADFETIIPSSFPAVGFEFSDPNYTDIAPRLGATYRLNQKTVLRAGYGIYYNPNQMNSFTFLTNNPPIAAVSTFSSDPANPTLSFDHPFGVVGPGGPPDMISPTRDLPNARKDQWSLDVQRELGTTAALDLQYVGSNTSHLDRSFFNNTPQPGPGPVDPRRPSPNFRSRRIIQNDLIADYDAVSVILRKRMSRGLQADVHYTWSRTRDMATHSNGGGQTMNNYDIWADYGPANWDIPHRFVANYIYDVPFLKESPQPILRYVVAGWQIGGVTTIQSGTPVNVTIPADRANIGISGLQRPDLVGAVPELNCQQSPTSPDLINCFDPSAFATPAQYTFGNAPRNVLRGPKAMITDLSLVKNVPVSGSMRVQIRAEIFNAFNTVNYGNPNAVFGSATFGRISATNSTYPNMRQIQLGAKLMF
ncbi:MAG TPA: TonB-dependent receptor [Vicinamibacterales bacterium]|nr:TonB-dependent receptor [Vicinamibacterales bacterium]